MKRQRVAVEDGAGRVVADQERVGNGVIYRDRFGTTIVNGDRNGTNDEESRAVTVAAWAALAGGPKESTTRGTGRPPQPALMAKHRAALIEGVERGTPTCRRADLASLFARGLVDRAGRWTAVAQAGAEILIAARDHGGLAP